MATSAITQKILGQDSSQAIACLALPALRAARKSVKPLVQSAGDDLISAHCCKYRQALH